MNLLRSASDFVRPLLVILLPLALITGFYFGKNTAQKMPTIQQVQINDGNMRDVKHVQALLDRYRQTGFVAELRWQEHTKKPLSQEQREIHQWVYSAALHPCPLPDDMLTMHHDALMRASTELVLMEGKK